MEGAGGGAGAPAGASPAAPVPTVAAAAPAATALSKRDRLQKDSVISSPAPDGAPPAACQPQDNLVPEQPGIKMARSSQIMRGAGACQPAHHFGPATANEEPGDQEPDGPFEPASADMGRTSPACVEDPTHLLLAQASLPKQPRMGLRSGQGRIDDAGSKPPALIPWGPPSSLLALSPALAPGSGDAAAAVAPPMQHLASSPFNTAGASAESGGTHKRNKPDVSLLWRDHRHSKHR